MVKDQLMFLVSDPKRSHISQHDVLAALKKINRQICRADYKPKTITQKKKSLWLSCLDEAIRVVCKSLQVRKKYSQLKSDIDPPMEMGDSMTLLIDTPSLS